MSCPRLETEQQRLYHRHAAAGLLDTHGQTRALVLELVQPADWDSLGRVWQCVQDELLLPAPGIAVSGGDAYQLWFSVAEAVNVAQAQRFLQGLCQRYLGHLPPSRWRWWPQPPGHEGATPADNPSVPPVATANGHWSAFIKPELATVFTEPRLEFAPNLDAQAQLLAALQPTPVADFERALQQLQPNAPPASPASVVPPAPTPPTASPALPHTAHPRDFLLAVMNDPGTDLQWRIEAAKALLPWFER